MPFHRGFNTESKLSMPYLKQRVLTKHFQKHLIQLSNLMLKLYFKTYGADASAKAAKQSAVIVRTFCCSSVKPLSTISTSAFKCGKTAQPMRIAICWTILMPKSIRIRIPKIRQILPVCRACQLFLLLQTAFKNGNNAGMPSAEATTANARAVVFRTYSST